jgi:hypothetical protein
VKFGIRATASLDRAGSTSFCVFTKKITSLHREFKSTIGKYRPRPSLKLQILVEKKELFFEE